MKPIPARNIYIMFSHANNLHFKLFNLCGPDPLVGNLTFSSFISQRLKQVMCQFHAFPFLLFLTSSYLHFLACHAAETDLVLVLCGQCPLLQTLAFDLSVALSQLMGAKLWPLWHCAPWLPPTPALCFFFLPGRGMLRSPSRSPRGFCLHTPSSRDSVLSKMGWLLLTAPSPCPSSSPNPSEKC